MLGKKHVVFPGRLVIVGFGSIGQGVLPLLLRHIGLNSDQITIVTAELRGQQVAAEYGARFVETALTRENYRGVLEKWLGPGDFLLNVARGDDPGAAAPTDRAGWGRLAHRLGVKAIHIAERDTQVSRIPKAPGEFVNTWSIDGFFSEGSQPAELGWGTHERHFPA